MTYKLELDNPGYPKGEEFHVPHFPVGLVNGHQVTVSDEQVEAYEQFTGNKFEDVAKGIVGMKVTTAKAERGDS